LDLACSFGDSDSVISFMNPDCDSFSRKLAVHS
jgi:hypothetical protein